MLNKILCLLVALCMGLTAAAQENNEARQLLDRVADTFRQAEGVEIAFEVRAPEGTSEGRIRLKGEKFRLDTEGITTWFDGRTQWTYLENSDEVNVSEPTAEELQSINPYAFIGLYKQGYTYRVGARKNYQGKAIDEIDLQAENPKQEIQAVKLYVDKRNAQPLYIKITDCNKNINEIEVTSLKKALLLPDNRFIFDTKQYPNAEVIDLR